MNKILYKNKGYSLLLILVVIGAITLAIATSLILFGIDASRNSLSLQQSYQAKYLADACAEKALQEIRDSTPFTGSNTIIFSEGSCEYLVTNTGGQNRNIKASSTVSFVVRKVEINIDKINPDINISSWQQVADF